MFNEKELEQTSRVISKISTPNEHLVERFMKMEQPFQIECSVFGIGMAIQSLGNAVKRCDIPSEKIMVISGIQCTSVVARNVKVDSFNTTRGRAIPFAVGMKLANPKLNVVVLGADQDLFAIGGSHFINAARRNIDITVICVNNFNYKLTLEQTITNSNEETGMNPFSVGDYDKLFNIPVLADMAGAVYVARWTAFHFRRVTDSILYALNKPGFSFIEILAPCPETFENADGLKNKLDRLKWYYEKSVIHNDANTKEVDIGPGEEIIIGQFVDRERQIYLQSLIEQYKFKLGDKYKPYEG